jgi:Spy/CpxP family protein refolding chaperone
MDQIKRNRAFKWFNYLLLVVNLTALITIFMVNRPTETGTKENQEISLKFLKERLNLTPDQYQELIKVSEKTFRAYHVNIDLLCEANIQLLEEISKDNPDQEEIEKLVKKIGNINTTIKRNTAKHFEQVKAICNEEQRAKLVLLFKEIMQLEEQCAICNRKECPRKERLQNLGKK